MKIITATKREYQLIWCGISTIDQALRFSIKSKNFTEVTSVFSNPEETSVLKYVIDPLSQPKIYEGYTNLIGVSKDTDETLVVALKNT